MDPNSCLEDIASNLEASKYSKHAGIALDFACQDLYNWLRSGGFPPDWEDFDFSGSNGNPVNYYRSMEVQFQRGVSIDVY